LQVWGEPPTAERPDRFSRVVTTRAALQAYADSSTSRRRLRGENESPPSASLGSPGPGTYGWVGRDIYELRALVEELRSRIEALEGR
ncbi:MAG: hypothetical protein ACR2HI_11180, partial [Gaiella sp.]